jgi:hypothetical protein
VKGLSPTQRTLRALREQGRIAAITEKWNPHVGPFGIRQDLFGFVDVLALDPVRGFVAIQSTGQAFSEHEKKILDSPCTENVIAWLKTPGGAVELWGWRKLKLHKGGKAMRWQPRVRVFTLADFPHGLKGGAK